jgi:hypothetical protein
VTNQTKYLTRINPITLWVGLAGALNPSISFIPYGKLAFDSRVFNLCDAFQERNYCLNRKVPVL